MEINVTGLASRDLLPNRSNIEQDLAQKVQEKEEVQPLTPKPLEPRPVEEASSDKLGRIDIYA